VAIYLGVKADDSSAASSANISQTASGVVTAPKSISTVTEISKKMQKAFDESSMTGVQYPEIGYWRKEIRDILTTKWPNLDKEVINDWIEPMLQDASALVK
jgi:hypothetical protein